jgi:hypothetical protein
MCNLLHAKREMGSTHKQSIDVYCVKSPVRTMMKRKKIKKEKRLAGFNWNIRGARGTKLKVILFVIPQIPNIWILLSSKRQLDRISQSRCFCQLGKFIL